MGINGGVAEDFVDPVEQAVADGVFQLFCLFVDFGPVQVKYLDEKELKKAVAAEYSEAFLEAVFGQGYADSGLVVYQSGSCQVFHHGCYRSRCHAESLGQVAQSDKVGSGRLG